MEWDFRNRELIKLYENGKSKNYRVERSVLEDFFGLIEIIGAAQDIHDLWRSPSINFEKMKGFKSRYSMRLGRKYRLECEVEWENPQKTVGKFYIIELSKHYGD